MFCEKKLSASQKKCIVLTAETVRLHVAWHFIVCHPRSITIPGVKILLSCFTVSKQMIKSKWKYRRWTNPRLSPTFLYSTFDIIC